MVDKYRRVDMWHIVIFPAVVMIISVCLYIYIYIYIYIYQIYDYTLSIN
jgi:hypothetical protein